MNTTVEPKDRAEMAFTLTMDGDEVSIVVTGYKDPLTAIKALYYMGQEEQLRAIADEYEVAAKANS